MEQPFVLLLFCFVFCGSPINFWLGNEPKQLECKRRTSTSGRLCFIISADAQVVITGVAQEKSGKAGASLEPKERGAIETFWMKYGVYYSFLLSRQGRLS